MMNRRQLSFLVASVLSLCFVMLSLHTYVALGKGMVDLPNMFAQMTNPRPPVVHLQHYPKKIWQGWFGDSDADIIIRSPEGGEDLADFIASTWIEP